MNIEITSIDKSNIKYFAPYMYKRLLPDEGAVGLIMDDEAAGIGIFYAEGSACIIRHFFIDEDYRRKGGGTKLFESVRDVLRENGIRTFLAYYNESDEITGFLRSVGFDCMSSSPLYSFSSSDLLETPVANQVDKGLPKDICTLEDLNIERMDEMKELIVKEGFSKSLLDYGSYDPDLSVAVVKDDKIRGLLLQKKEDDDFYVSMLLHDGHDSSMGMLLIRAFCVILSENASPESRVIFAGYYGKLVDKLKELLPDEKGLTAASHAWTGVLRVL